MTDIKLYFRTVDGIRSRRYFKTLKGARKFTWNWMGRNVDIGRTYAVSGDGIITVTAHGCSLEELFDREPADEWYHPVEHDDLPY